VGKAGIGVLLNNPHAIAEAMVRFTKETFETELQAKKYHWTKFAERVYDILKA
jgi:hypothetical protein